MFQKSFRLLILFVLLPILLFQVSTAQVALDADKLDQYLTALVEHDKFMGSVAILHGDKIIFQNSYGYVDEEQSPAQPETVYRIGSITKTFTATMILRLVEEGKLELTDNLDQYYPEMPNSGEITIEQLLKHRSGLGIFRISPGGDEQKRTTCAICRIWYKL